MCVVIIWLELGRERQAAREIKQGRGTTLTHHASLLAQPLKNPQKWQKRNMVAWIP